MSIEVNPENGKKFEVKKSPFEEFPHLAALMNEAKSVHYGSCRYWEMRCIYLEKTIDETYSVFERNNSRELYKTLVNKSK